jgi:Fe2+ or Zn2+ uptake regulation protein
MVKKINEELFSDIINSLTGNRLTGYQIYNLLREKYPHLSKRLVYHYLYIALKRGEVAVDKVMEEGKFSWGHTTEKKYYTRAV